MEFDVTIEIPKGHRNKYEVDHETGRIRLDRMLFTATAYPADYGYVEDTARRGRRPARRARAARRADLPRLPDAGPPDRHVPHARRGRRRRQDPVRPGRRPAQGPHPRDRGRQPTFDRLEIQHFFETYKDLEPGKSVEGAHWAGREDAERCIREAFERAKDGRHQHGPLADAGARRLARGRLRAAHRRRDLGRVRAGPQRARDQGPPAQRRLTPTFSPDPGTFTFAPEPFRCEGEGSGVEARVTSPRSRARP